MLVLLYIYRFNLFLLCFTISLFCTKNLTVNQRVLGSSPRGGAESLPILVGFFVFCSSDHVAYNLHPPSILKYSVSCSQNP